MRRWLDNNRFLLWDEQLRKAFLWDVRSPGSTGLERTEDQALERLVRVEFVFSRDRQTLFRLRSVVETDIWALEILGPGR